MTQVSAFASPQLPIFLTLSQFFSASLPDFLSDAEIFNRFLKKEINENAV